MGAAAWLLIAWIVVAAVWMFIHVFSLVRVLQRGEIPAAHKALSLLPIATPIVAWKHGLRGLAATWLGLALVYAVLRAFG